MTQAATVCSFIGGRARTLGGRSLSFEGIDATYAASVAILRRILALEQARVGA